MAEAGRLQQRRVLITGAASGIGRRTALLFAAEGAALTLLDRSMERLAEVARETGGLADPKRTGGRLRSCSVGQIGAGSGSILPNRRRRQQPPRP